jgi:hypothetical protein
MGKGGRSLLHTEKLGIDKSLFFGGKSGETGKILLSGLEYNKIGVIYHPKGDYV